MIRITSDNHISYFLPKVPPISSHKIHPLTQTRKVQTDLMKLYTWFSKNNWINILTKSDNNVEWRGRRDKICKLYDIGVTKFHGIHVQSGEQSSTNLICRIHLSHKTQNFTASLLYSCLCLYYSSLLHAVDIRIKSTTGS